MNDVFQQGGGAGIGSYVIVFRNGEMDLNTDLGKVRGAYEAGDAIFFSIIDDETEEALVPASGWVGNDGNLHLVARDFDDGKTYDVELAKGGQSAVYEVKEGITLGEGEIPAPVTIEGNSLVIPEQPAPEPVIEIDGVKYYHKIDTKDIELPTENGTTYLYNLSGNLIKTDVKPALPYILVNKLNNNIEMRLLSSDVDYMGNASVVYIFKATAALSDSGTIPVQATHVPFSLNEEYFTAGYLQVDADTHNSIIYYNLVNEAPEYIDSVKQGNAVIPMHDQRVAQLQEDIASKQPDMGIIVIPGTITSNSTLQDIIDLGIGIEAQPNRSYQYYVYFVNEMHFSYASDAFHGFATLNITTFGSPSIQIVSDLFGKSISNGGPRAIVRVIANGLGSDTRIYDYTQRVFYEVIDHASTIAPNYSNTATYDVNDLVFYNNLLYRCTTAIATAEEWTSAHWTQTTIADELKALRALIPAQ